MNILQAFDHPDLFGGAIRNPETFYAWRVFLSALFGLTVAEEDLKLFTECTGRTTAPTKAFQEAWLICGRRSGKSFVMALVAVFLACFRDYSQYLAPGERATLMVIAADRRQSRVIMRYIAGLLTIPILAKLLESERAESFDLTNRVTIEVATASIKSVRGYTIAACLCDEISFWGDDESANADRDVIASILPAMVTIPGAVLLCASSPYAARGALYDADRKHWGKNDAPVLIWRAPTRTMNPTVPQKVIDDAIEADAASAASEYLAQYRTDVSSFFGRDEVLAAVAEGVYERAPLWEFDYSGFADPSGGSSDSFTLAVGHCEDDRVIIDAVREWKPPFSPDKVVREACELLKSYRISEIRGDRYAAAFNEEKFRENGIAYRPSEKPKSDLYLNTLPMMNSGRVELLDNQRLITQLIALERRTGRDSVDHAPGNKDDLANSVAGVIAHATTRRPRRREVYFA